MKLEDTKTSIRLIAGITCIALFASCATAPHTARGPEYAPTAKLMREARSANVPVEKRAADYLQAAAMTAPLLETGIGTPACETYNAACGELTVLLRSSEGGRLWNHPLTLNGSKTYHLRLEPASNAVWAPNYFTTFESPDQIKEKLIRKEKHSGRRWRCARRSANRQSTRKVRAGQGNHCTGHSYARFSCNGCYPRTSSSRQATDGQR